MKTRTVLFLFFMLSCQGLFSQERRVVEGKIRDFATGQALPYVLVYNVSTQSGAISNDEGYFSIYIQSKKDSVVLRFLSYQDTVLALNDQQNYYEVFLKSIAVRLNEVIIRPTDNSFLYDLISSLRQAIPSISSQYKAYFNLKSFSDSHQVEMLEAYYNAKTYAYTINNLELKRGRIALNPGKAGFFVSLESSIAILMHSLFKTSPYFPVNPLELNAKELKSKFNLGLEDAYTDLQGDSIFIIDYEPSAKCSSCFSGKIWVNKTKLRLQKIRLSAQQSLKHPFVPLFDRDQINGVDFELNYTFNQGTDVDVFQHIDFNYNVHYSSRKNTPLGLDQIIQTKAVLYFYDPGAAFLFPILHKSSHTSRLGDYRQISSMPYNEYFWEKSPRYGMNDSLHANTKFFKDTTNLSSLNLFQKNKISAKGFFEYPFVAWSRKGLEIDTVIGQTPSTNLKLKGFKESYNLEVKIFLDIIPCEDSLQITTQTIFDPFDSFYFYPITPETRCFVNLYFDWCEIARQEFDKALRLNAKNSFQAYEMYQHFLIEFDKRKTAFMQSTRRGLNKKGMLYYNQQIFEKLGINNVELYQLYEEPENTDQSKQ